MPKHFLIIDGYNLMHTSTMLRRLDAGGNLEQSRDQMIDFLAAHLTKGERERTKIVFDAVNAPGLYGTKFQRANMKIIFPTPGTDADSEIERMISRHHSPKLVLVVSGDRRLQKAIRKRKGRFIGSAGFVRKLLDRGEFSRSDELAFSEKRDRRPSSEEVSYWMAIFSDVESEVKKDRQKKERSKSSQTAKKSGKPGNRDRKKTSKKSIHTDPNHRTPEQELLLWEKRIADLYDE